MSVSSSLPDVSKEQTTNGKISLSSYVLLVQALNLIYLMCMLKSNRFLYIFVFIVMLYIRIKLKLIILIYKTDEFLCGRFRLWTRTKHY